MSRIQYIRYTDGHALKVDVALVVNSNSPIHVCYFYLRSLDTAAMGDMKVHIMFNTRKGLGASKDTFSWVNIKQRKPQLLKT